MPLSKKQMMARRERRAELAARARAEEVTRAMCDASTFGASFGSDAPEFSKDANETWRFDFTYTNGSETTVIATLERTGEKSSFVFHEKALDSLGYSFEELRSIGRTIVDYFGTGYAEGFAGKDSYDAKVS